jgi:type VI protein secretion system component Hcp
MPEIIYVRIAGKYISGQNRGERYQGWETPSGWQSWMMQG